MNKLPCRRCGKLVAATRNNESRYPHRCPHNVECVPQWGKPCEECRVNWPKFKELAGAAELQAQGEMIRMAKAK
jgi:hypothetical protein